LGTDFTTPLETPGAEPGAEETPAPEETAPGTEDLAELTRKKMDNRRNRITESIKKTIGEIDNLINE